MKENVEKKRANKRKEDEEETEGKDKDGEEVLEGAEEETKIPRVTVTRLCTPLPSKNRHEVLKAIIDMYLRLRSDGPG
jgi:reverse gyrase